MKASIPFLLALFGALNACKPQLTDSPEIPVSIITGEISVPVKEDIVLLPPAFKPDIASLRNKGDTSAIRMIALSGSFPAGTRNGGLYREGQMTSIPELLAHQMQLESFVTPLFDSQNGNRSGYLVYDREARFPSWKRVSNQTGIVSATPLAYTPFIGSYINNISCPEGPGTNSDSTNSYFFYPAGKTPYFSYLFRFFPNQGVEQTPFNTSPIPSVKSLISYCTLKT